MGTTRPAEATQIGDGRMTGGMMIRDIIVGRQRTTPVEIDLTETTVTRSAVTTTTNHDDAPVKDRQTGMLQISGDELTDYFFCSSVQYVLIPYAI